MKMKRLIFKRTLSAVLILLLAIPVGMAGFIVSATGDTYPGLIESVNASDATLVTTFKSSNTTDNDYFECTIFNDSTITISIMGKTYDSGNNSWIKFFIRQSNGSYGRNYVEIGLNDDGTYAGRLSFRDSLSDGEYLLAARLSSDADSSVSSAYSIKGVPLKIKDGKAYFLQYQSLINQNIQLREAADYDPYRYLDKNGADIKETGGGLTDTQVQYLQRVADDITANATTMMEKMMLIHNWVSDNLYYDHSLDNTGIIDYEKNPYTLVKSIKDGNKTKTRCNGFAAIVAMLARCENIPCRTVIGHAISMPSQRWETESTALNKDDHYWNEAYVDGRWALLDCTRDCVNSYNKDKTWTKNNFVRYDYFDPTDESIAVTHLSLKYYAPSAEGVEISNEEEIAQLKTFLNYTKDGKKNGTVINSNYSENNTKTWGALSADADGNVDKIDWSGKKTLAGPLNLSKLSQLKQLTIYTNKITSLTVPAGDNLQRIYANYNSLKKIDVTSLTNLKELAVLNNSLTSAKYKFNVETDSVDDAGVPTTTTTTYTGTLTAGANGTFGLHYNQTNGTHRLVAYPASGYALKGWYTASGTLISSKADVTLTNRKTYSYNAKFVRADKTVITSISGYGKKVTLTYDEVKGAAKYYIYRSTKSGSGYKKIGSSTSLKYVNSTVIGGTKYYYKVRGVTSGGTLKTLSAYKAVVPLGTPKISKVSKTSSKTTVTWGSASGAKRYYVYRSATKDGAYTKLGYTSKRTYTDKTAKGKKYYYKVRAAKVISSVVYYGDYSAAKTNA
jgi:transglutaminase-like putative cysteine protease